MAVEIHGEPRPLAGAVNTALFRMAQEALTNTIKHANARQAWLRLRYAPDLVTLTIEDDGVGFDAERKAGSERGVCSAWKNAPTCWAGPCRS